MEDAGSGKIIMLTEDNLGILKSRGNEGKVKKRSRKMGGKNQIIKKKKL